MTENGFAYSLKNNTLKVETLINIANILDKPIADFFKESISNRNYVNESIENYERKSKCKECDIKDKLIESFSEQIKGLKRELYLLTNDEAYKQTKAS
jgi:hypothetical protein